MARIYELVSDAEMLLYCASFVDTNNAYDYRKYKKRFYIDIYIKTVLKFKFMIFVEPYIENRRSRRTRRNRLNVFLFVTRIENGSKIRRKT